MEPGHYKMEPGILNFFFSARKVWQLTRLEFEPKFMQWRAAWRQGQGVAGSEEQ